MFCGVVVSYCVIWFLCLCCDVVVLLLYFGVVFDEFEFFWCFFWVFVFDVEEFCVCGVDEFDEDCVCFGCVFGYGCVLCDGVVKCICVCEMIMCGLVLMM